MMYPTLLKQYHFYCMECEQKTKAMLYFRTWCPCKESSVIATVDTIAYHGCAIPDTDWEVKNEAFIGPVSSDFLFRS